MLRHMERDAALLCTDSGSDNRSLSEADATDAGHGVAMSDDGVAMSGVGEDSEGGDEEPEWFNPDSISSESDGDGRFAWWDPRDSDSEQSSGEGSGEGASDEESEENEEDDGGEYGGGPAGVAMCGLFAARCRASVVAVWQQCAVFNSLGAACTT